MPTYEYLCQACGHEMEEFQSITAKPLKKCPECKKNKLKRLIGMGSGVIFKGSGFWETDYNRSKDYKTKSKKEKSDATAASKSDTKKDATKETKSTDSKSTTKSDATTKKSSSKKKD